MGLKNTPSGPCKKPLLVRAERMPQVTAGQEFCCKHDLTWVYERPRELHNLLRHTTLL